MRIVHTSGEPQFPAVLGSAVQVLQCGEEQVRLALADRQGGEESQGQKPYYITPILMTATMFIQQAITPSTADPAQKKMFLIMPLVMGWIFKEFPTGLVLYWLMQNLLTIVQQLLMNKFTDPAERT